MTSFSSLRDKACISDVIVDQFGVSSDSIVSFSSMKRVRVEFDDEMGDRRWMSGLHVTDPKVGSGGFMNGDLAMCSVFDFCSSQQTRRTRPRYHRQHVVPSTCEHTIQRATQTPFGRLISAASLCSTTNATSSTVGSFATARIPCSSSCTFSSPSTKLLRRLQSLR